MKSLGQTEQKKWEQQRSLLLDHTNKNQKKEWLSRNILAIASGSKFAAKKAARAVNDKQRNADVHIDVGDTGLDKNSIKQIAAALPGSFLHYIKICKQQPPQYRRNNSSRNTITIIEAKKEAYGICVYDPREDPSQLAEAVCHSCLQAHTRFAFPRNLHAETVDSINKAVNIPGHEFFVIQKDLLHKPGRAKSKTQEEKARALLVSFIQTVYNAPFVNQKGGWQDAGLQALVGMQFLNQEQAEGVIESLEEYFQELEPQIDLNVSINQFQAAKQALVFNGNINKIIHLASLITDKGIRGFVKRWLEQLSESCHLPILESALVHQYTPSNKSKIALNDARELGANLVRSLRIGELSPVEDKQMASDLIFSIRRFNDMWSRLDKREKNFIKPKLVQVIHADQ